VACNSTPSWLCDSCQNYIVNLTDLNVAFVNIKSAFDSVDRTAFWKALRSKGMPDVILHLITALHENTGARIRVGQKLSSRISSTSGVRQDCILAPILFCVVIDWIIQHMSFSPGITVGSSTFTDLVYADTTLPCFFRRPPMLPHHSTASVILLHI